MERKNKIKIPKGFFSIVRPEISTKEALNEVVPVEWLEKSKKKSNKKLIKP